MKELGEKAIQFERFLRKRVQVHQGETRRFGWLKHSSDLSTDADFPPVVRSPRFHRSSSVAVRLRLARTKSATYAVCMRLLPYAQLLRLPNVFTAFADILLGALAAGTLLAQPLASAALLLASGCLYCAGMVWNDYFDIAIDRKERPFRPLPSGKISLGAARLLGLGLLAMGLLFAGIAGWSPEGWSSEPVIIASTLVAAILCYDGWLKQSPIGPISMGACRFLNVLLGTSLAAPGVLSPGHRLHLALVIGLYIVGVTWFAR